MEQVQRTVRLIRSKGVGVFFITQLPQDLPDEVLAQLGNRVQHALRAITPKDAAAIDKTVQTYPMTEVYDLASALTSLPSPRAYRSSDAPAETTISLASVGAPASRLIASTNGGCVSWASSMTASFPEGRPRALFFQATRRARSPGR